MKTTFQLRWEIERLSTFRNRWIFGRIQLKKLVKRQYQKGSISMKFIPRLYCNYKAQTILHSIINSEPSSLRSKQSVEIFWESVNILELCSCYLCHSLSIQYQEESTFTWVKVWTVHSRQQHTWNLEYRFNSRIFWQVKILKKVLFKNLGLKVFIFIWLESSIFSKKLFWGVGEQYL